MLKKNKFLWLLSALFLFSNIQSFAFVQAAPSVPSLDHIRVALFISHENYQVNTPGVHVSAQGPLQLAWEGAKWGISDKKVHVNLEQFEVNWIETSDISVARNVRDQLSNSTSAYISEREDAGKTKYIVYSGSYQSASEAKEVIDRLSATLKGVTPKTTGAERWSSGLYTTEQEAEAVAQLLISANIPAFVGLVQEQNSIRYTVLAGEEVNTTARDALLPSIQAQVANVKWQPANGQTYILMKPSTSEGMVHYSLSSKAVFTVKGQESGLVVQERAGRAYRGDIEIREYNNRLAAINDVLFEHYLYGVVSTELSKSWPIEAMKAQAVAARTFALQLGEKYGIAHTSDSTSDQAYYGLNQEFSEAHTAVKATEGEVLVDDNGLITPLYHSNAGSRTADPLEVWGREIPYIHSVPSPDDVAEQGKLDWLRVQSKEGLVGYIRSDLLTDTGQVNGGNFPIYRSIGDAVQMRNAPYVDNQTNAAIATLTSGEEVVVIGKDAESNAYYWIRGPFSSQTLAAKLQNSLQGESLRSLLVSNRGSESGRVTEIKANGQVVTVNRPEDYRTMFQLPSGRYDIEQTASVTMIGANGASKSIETHANSLTVLDGSLKESTLTIDPALAMNSEGQVRVITKDPTFRFIGLGYGHGLGMSQWGARGYAELGYDYKEILQHYYRNVTIVKG